MLLATSVWGGLTNVAAMAGPALPQGGTVVSGTATFSTGPNGAQLTVNQTSGKSILNWSSFSIGQGASVQINNGSGATLNRVTGTNISQINGILNATGSVYLINPNGVIIGKMGVVKTGGTFVASTLDIDNAAFLAGGTQHFSGSSQAAVINLGKVGVLGGNVVMIANVVKNGGSLSAPQGTVGLAAGSKITLRDQDHDGGGFLSVQVGAPSSAITNSGSIAAVTAELRAQQGNIYALAGNTGNAINATGIDARGGHIWLTNPGGITSVSGKLEAQGANGTPGQIETSGETLKIGKAEVNAHGGTWLQDPTDLTIDSTAASSIVTALNLGTSVTEQTTAGGANGNGVQSSGDGDITVASPIAWSGPGLLTLDSYHSVLVNAPIKVNGGGKVSILTNDNGGSGGILSFGTGSSLQFASGQSSQALSIDNNAYALEHDTLSLYIALNTDSINGTNGHYALATPVAGGTYSAAPVPNFGGTLEGLGNTINGLTITSNGDNVGMIGTLRGTVRDLGLVGGVISGHYNVGALVGRNANTITQSYATAAVSGTSSVGGLVGENDHSTITKSYATGAVSGSQYVGGLVGNNNLATITQSYATGTVSGSSSGEAVGGLVGRNYGIFDNIDNQGIITQSYATGAVSGGTYVGGLVGFNRGYGTITQSYATGAVSGGTYIGGLAGQNKFSTILQSYATGTVGLGIGGSAGGLVGDNYGGTVTQSFATGAVRGGTYSALGGLVGRNQSFSIGTGFTASYWDTQTSGMVFGTEFASFDPLQEAGMTGLTTAQLQSNFGGVVGALNANTAGASTTAFSGGTGGLYPYLSAFFPNGVQAVNGFAFGNAGTAPAPTVSILDNGTAYATAVTEANGYYYVLAPAGTLGSGHSLLAYTDTGATLTTSTGATVQSNVDVFGDTLTVPTTATMLSAAPSLSAARVSALAADGGNIAAAAIINTATGRGFIATGASFTVDQAVTSSSNLVIDSTASANTPITVDAPITLSGTGGLGLLSNGLITIDAPVTITGMGAVGLVPGLDTSLPDVSLAQIRFAPDSFQFTGTPGGGQTLAMNGVAYTLEYSTTGLFNALNTDFTNNTNGHYALAVPVVASGVYTAAPVTSFSGTLEGLGNTISGLAVNGGAYTGMIGSLGTVGGPRTPAGPLVRDLGLVGGSMTSGNYASPFVYTGGLVGTQWGGTIAQSYTTGSVTGVGYAGGIAAENYGLITQSYATGAVSGERFVGGLVGRNDALIVQSYAMGAVSNPGGAGVTGGLVGGFFQGAIIQSFATGNASSAGRQGGLVGAGDTNAITASYWNTQTTGPATHALATYGAGLTTAQLQSGNYLSALNAATPGGSTTAFSGGTGGLYPYMTAIYPNGAQAITGTALRSDGTPAASAQVAISIGGVQLGGTVSVGLNGAVYALAPAGTFTAGTKAVGAFVTLPGVTTANDMGLAFSDQAATTADILTLPAINAGTISETTTATSQSALQTKLNATFGSAAYSTALAAVATDPLTVTATGSGGFTVDQAINAGGSYNLIASGGPVTINHLIAAGGSILIAANGAFVNSAGANALTPGTGDNFTVYSQAPGDVAGTLPTDTIGGLSAVNWYNDAYDFATDTFASAVPTGNTLVYGYAAHLTPTLGGSATKTYDGTTTAATSGLTVGATFLNANGVNDSASFALSGTASYASNSAGTGKLVTATGVSLTSNPNNYILDGTTASGQVGTITPAALTITAADQSKTYGTVFNLGTTGFTETGLITGIGDSISGVTLASTGAAASATVAGGPYVIAASNAQGTGLSNYTISYGNGALTVDPASLTITASNRSKTYGTTLNLGTTAFTETGLVTGNGDTISGVTLASAGAAAGATVAGGPYAISVSNALGSGLANYIISYNSAPVGLTVDPASLTITANNASKTYGAASNLGTTAFTETGLVTGNGDTISGVTLASAGTAAGAAVAGSPYVITTSNAQGSGLANYTISYNSAPIGLTVDPASLTITASNQSKTYGQAASLGTTAFTETGLLNSDTISGVTLTSAGAAAGATVAGGPYAITTSNAQGTGLSNYTISYNSAPIGLIVDPASLTITASNRSKTYGATLSLGSTGFTEMGLVTSNGDSISGVTLTSAGAAAGATVAGGPYAITVSNAQGARLANYTISYQNAVTGLTVDPASLTVTANNASKLYGAALPVLTASYDGFVNGDTFANLTSAPTLTTTATSNSDVNHYTITASGAADSNYAISYALGQLTVNPATLTYTANAASSIYGSTPSGLTGTVTGFVLGQNQATATTGTLSFGTTATSASHVGNYAVTGSGLTADNGNYTFLQATGNANALTIDPRALIFTGTQVYNGTTSVAGTALAVTNLVGTDSVTVSGSAAMTGKDVGTEALTSLTGLTLNNTNYTLVGGSGSVDVTPATLVYTATTANSIYGSTPSGLAGTVTGFVGSDTQVTATTGTLSFATTATATSHVGSYAITGSGLAADNGDYTFVQAAANAMALTIDPASLTITASNQSKTYGQTASLGTTAFTETGLLNSDTISRVTLASTGTAVTATVAGGPYVIAASNAQGTGLSNYTISYGNGALTVDPASLTITASNRSKTYGATLNLGTTAFTETGLINNDAINGVTLASNGAVAGATVAGGPYAITVSNAQGAGLSNYTISYNGAPIGLTVDPASLTITASNRSKTYGATLNLGTTAFTETGLVNNDTISGVTLASIGAAAGAAVAGGPYVITTSNAQGSGLSNYIISYQNAVTGLTVDPAALIITANNASKTYGTAFNLGATAFSETGLVNNDTISGVTLVSAGAAATATVTGGPYVISVSNAQGVGLSNYTIFYQNAVTGLTVDPASLTIAALDRSKTYGTTFNLGTTAFTETGLVTGNGDSISSVTLASAGAAAGATVAGGPYAISVSNAQGLSLSNYTISYQNAVTGLTVDPASLTITANNASKLYGAALPVLTVSYDGFVNGDMSANLTTGPTLSTTATSNSDVSQYTITASGAADSNYAISYVLGHLTVNPATLTYTANTARSTYGSTPIASTGTVTGFVLGQNQATATTGTLSFGTTATSASHVGNYAVTGSGLTADNGNYVFVQAAGNASALTIDPAALTITASNQSKIYGQAASLGTTAFTETGLVNNDTISGVTLASAGAAATAAVAGGPYVIAASNARGAGLSNYTISYGNGALTVDPASLTITANNASKTYGTAFNLGTIAFTETGLVNSDTISGVTLASTGAAAGAIVAGGSYAIVASNAQGTGLSNYTISYGNGALTVDPASLTITANNASKIYGMAFNLGTTAFTETGLVNNDTISGVTLASIGVAAGATVAGGPYVITTSNAQGSGLANYTISYGNGALTVNPASLTITASDQSKIYGQAASLGTTAFTEMGLLNSDSISGVTLASAGAAATAAVAGGPYAITVSNAQGAGLANYTISYKSAPIGLTIDPAALTITALGGTSMVDTAPANPGLSAIGLQNGQGVSVLLGLSNSFGITPDTDAGSYTLDVTGTLSNSNYVIAARNTGTWVVTATPPAPIVPNSTVGSTPNVGTFTVLNGLLPTDQIPGFFQTLIDKAEQNDAPCPGDPNCSILPYPANRDVGVDITFIASH